MLLALGLLAASAAADERADLRGELEALRDANGVAGFGLVLVDLEAVDQVLVGGLADWNSARPVERNDYVRIGSITKAFTGLGFIAAEREGTVDLDAPIAPDLAPNLFDNRWHPDRPVTLAMLLEHTAGLRDMAKAEWDFNDPVSLTEALAVEPSSRVLAWPPGIQSVYSNSGAGVAAHVFEVQSGEDFEAWVESTVFEPLGMGSATFRRTDEVTAGLMTGYDTDGRTPIKYWHQLYRPFGSINVRLPEIGRFVRMLLGRGTLDGQAIFSEAEIERMERPTTTAAARAGLTFGYGLGNYARINERLVWHGHGGDADGYLSHFGYSPTLGKGYFLVINAFQNRTLRAMRGKVEAYLAGDSSENFEAPRPRPAAELAALAGTYHRTAARFGPANGSVEVTFEDGRLRLVRGNRSEVLLPLPSGHFRRSFEPIATTTFARVGNRIYLQGSFGDFERQGHR
ncbi:MAG: serine hydrolase domain-containing protein [Pseudomonadota bacterium]